MLFRNLLLVIPALFSLGAKAATIPVTRSTDLVARTSEIDSIVPRCDTCESGPGIGSGVGASIHASVDVDVALKVFTHEHLSYASELVSIFAQVKGDVKVVAHAVLNIGTSLYAWSTADLVKLCGALDAYIAGTVTTNVDIFVKAGIDVTVFTKEHASCLKAFVTTCIETDVDIAAQVKADIALFVSNSIVVAGNSCTDLSTKISAHLSALLNVIASLKLDAKVATCASAAVAVKLALRTFIKSCLSSTTGLLALLVEIPLSALLLVVEAWIKADLSGLTGTALSLLGINLKASADVTICKAIVQYLLQLSAKFNFVASLKLDATVYTKVFSTVVAH
ncbi:hypothetical protein FRC04_011333 [Tulasnella sp. 424]|nr:hypothetical protein FRC04_011333 [Tulasnella sp. 424]KAG8975498.1 hypothetical protein FRC05_005567 [Tulasnella sp. 425]